MPDEVYECPACGTSCSSLETTVDVQDVYDVEPLWDGGPLVETGFSPVRQRVIARWLTFRPCGHRLPAEGLEVTSRRV